MPTDARHLQHWICWQTQHNSAQPQAPTCKPPCRCITQASALDSGASMACSMLCSCTDCKLSWCWTPPRPVGAGWTTITVSCRWACVPSRSIQTSCADGDTFFVCFIEDVQHVHARICCTRRGTGCTMHTMSRGLTALPQVSPFATIGYRQPIITAKSRFGLVQTEHLHFGDQINCTMIVHFVRIPAAVA